jgi:hypothetical protein
MSSRHQNRNYQRFLEEAEALNLEDREELVGVLEKLSDEDQSEELEQFKKYLISNHDETDVNGPFSVCEDAKTGGGGPINGVDPRRRGVIEVCESAWPVIETNDNTHTHMVRILNKLFEVYVVDTKRLYKYDSIENAISDKDEDGSVLGYELMSAQFGDRWIALIYCLRAINKFPDIFFNTRMHFEEKITFKTVPEILALCLVNQSTTGDITYKNSYNNRYTDKPLPSSPENKLMPSSHEEVVDRLCAELCDQAENNPEDYAYNTGRIFTAVLESEFYLPLESSTVVSRSLSRLRENENVIPYLPKAAFEISSSKY